MEGGKEDAVPEAIRPLWPITQAKRPLAALPGHYIKNYYYYC